MSPDAGAEAKARLRNEALARRRALPPAVREAFGRRLAEVGPQLALRLGARVASAFHPIRGEPDTLALLDSLARAGLATALPVTGARDAPLMFRRWRPGEPTVTGGLNIPEPAPEAPEVEPDLLFVPLSAFDRRGHRIGFGAGFYDRTLERLRAKGRVTAVGIAYGVSEVPHAPDEPHDQRLDFILTETELIDARGAS